MKRFEYVIKDGAGIHARPAGMLMKEARKYKSRAVLHAGEKSAEAERIMAVMGMGVKRGQTVAVEITGDDEEQAFEGLKKFFEENL